MTKPNEVGPWVLLSLALSGIIVAITVALSGCTPMERDQATADIYAACSTAMMLAPAAGPAAPFILAGCGSAEAIAKLASDPSSVAWVENLIAQAKAAANTPAAP